MTEVHWANRKYLSEVHGLTVPLPSERGCERFEKMCERFEKTRFEKTRNTKREVARQSAR